MTQESSVISCMACGESSRRFTLAELAALRGGFQGRVTAGHVGIEWVCPNGPNHAVVRLAFPGPIL